MEKVTGIVTGVNGNLITAEFDGSVKKNEVCYVCVGEIGRASCRERV